MCALPNPLPLSLPLCTLPLLPRPCDSPTVLNPASFSPLCRFDFAPAACRNERVHGAVLLSLADGNTRFAIGAGDWRWSDLLGLRAQNR